MVDVVQRWIVGNSVRLEKFNSQLALFVRKDGSRQYGDIESYDEFVTSKSPGEAVIIETCENAGLINESVAHALRHLLSVRNESVHAGRIEPSMHRTQSYMEQLVEVIGRPPFEDVAQLRREKDEDMGASR